MSDLKAEVSEIVSLVALVPEQFKAQCFELLLKDALSRRHAPPQPLASQPPAPQVVRAAGRDKVEPESNADALPDTRDERDSGSNPGKQPKVSSGNDIVSPDLHMKLRKFMERTGVSIEELNNVFYKEGDAFETLVTDLGVTGMAEGQIRVAMLQCLKQGLIDGELSTTVESVREECRMRKCYDATNFTKNFKNNAAYFDFGEWSREVKDLRLSEEGRKALAIAVKSYS